jgi:hypothetical protein
MSKQRTITVVVTALVVLTAISFGSASADERVPSPSTTTTTVIEQYDEESGIIWSQIDNSTIEVSLPD